jgi:hypothetical protein
MHQRPRLFPEIVMRHWSNHLINAAMSVATVTPLERDLRKLLPDATGTPAELAARIKAHISSERRRALSRHWSYDRNRHAALIRAYKQLTEGLKS